MNLTSLLPDEFDFYHLGSVRSLGERRLTEEPQFAGTRGVAFRIHDRRSAEELSWLILVFDEDLDVPTYTELGNIIASRLAGSLARVYSLTHGAWTSEPHPLNRQQLIRLFANRSGLEARAYHHVMRDRTVTVRAFVLGSSGEGEPIHV